MLKYLFSVKYKDGSEYRQTQEDKSVKEPDTRSCYYDVVQDQVASFSLEGEGHCYLVSLVDGHFEVDGVPFRMHELPLKDYRLVFWRTHTHSFNQRLDTGGIKEVNHEMVYRFGWQANDEKGNNIQEIMEID